MIAGELADLTGPQLNDLLTGRARQEEARRPSLKRLYRRVATLMPDRQSEILPTFTSTYVAQTIRPGGRNLPTPELWFAAPTEIYNGIFNSLLNTQ